MTATTVRVSLDDLERHARALATRIKDNGHKRRAIRVYPVREDAYTVAYMLGRYLSRYSVTEDVNAATIVLDVTHAPIMAAIHKERYFALFSRELMASMNAQILALPWSNTTPTLHDAVDAVLRSPVDRVLREIATRYT